MLSTMIRISPVRRDRAVPTATTTFDRSNPPRGVAAVIGGSFLRPRRRLRLSLSRLFGLGGRWLWLWLWLWLRLRQLAAFRAVGVVNGEAEALQLGDEIVDVVAQSEGVARADADLDSA